MLATLPEVVRRISIFLVLRGKCIRSARDTQAYCDLAEGNLPTHKVLCHSIMLCILDAMQP